jgi:anthranilate phosphoribosyltransferase
MAQVHGPSEFAEAGPHVDLLPIFERLLDGETLTAEETTRAFQSLMRGEAHDAEIGALLALLATRTPTSDELVGAARVMRANVDRVPTSIDPDRIVDTAGTGGAPKTFNVSTAAAIIAAAAGNGGFAVAKHGNRSRTGRGSAEALEALGVNVNCDRATQSRCLENAHLCFCFAIHHHPATRHVIAARKALRFATLFNLLGPLTNPAGAKRQVMGVYADRFVEPVAQALRDLGATRAIVLHSRDGLDEISLNAPTRLVHVERGTLREDEIDPRSLGFSAATPEALNAREVRDAAACLRAIVEGKDTGPRRDVALLNAAATLIVTGAAADFGNGIRRAWAAIDSGASAETLAQLISLSNAAR